MEGGHWPVGGWVGGGEGEGMRGREINEEALLPTHLPPPTAHRPPPQVVSGSAITQMRPTGGVATPRADALVDFGFFFPFSGLSSLVFISFSLKNQKRNWLFFGGAHGVMIYRVLPSFLFLVGISSLAPVWLESIVGSFGFTELFYRVFLSRSVLWLSFWLLSIVNQVNLVLKKN